MPALLPLLAPSGWRRAQPGRHPCHCVRCSTRVKQHHHSPGALAALSSWNPPHHGWAPSTSRTRISVSLFPLSKDVTLPWAGKGAAKQLSGLCRARFVAALFSASLAGARTSPPETWCVLFCVSHSPSFFKICILCIFCNCCMHSGVKELGGVGDPGLPAETSPMLWQRGHRGAKSQSHLRNV